MKVSSIILMLSVLFITEVVGQTYDEYTLKAAELHQNKNYKTSSEKWNKAFNAHKGYASDYYNAACTSALAGDKNQAFSYLKEAIKRGWEDIDWMKKDEDFNSLRTSKEWNDFLNEIPKLKDIYVNALNMKMKDELENLRMQDQTIRLLLPDAEKRFGRQSDAYKWFRNKLMSRNDSIVLVKIIDIIEKNGWMGISEVGELANQTIWLVVQHAPLKTQEKYLSHLKESVEKGESKARYLAFLKDRILMRKKEKQMYGTQSLWDKEKKKNVIWPIEDAKNVNKRRKEVGLETIEDYAKNNGFIYLSKKE